jgi:Right handed beta helix region
MKRVLSIFVILFCSLVTFPAWAATYTINNSTVTQTRGFAPAGRLAGGDMLVIPSGWTSHLSFLDVIGADGNPITITNPSNAKISITDRTTTSSSSISFVRCRYIVLDGSNYSSETYGIYLENGHFGIKIRQTEDIEIKYVEICDTRYPGIQWQNGAWDAAEDVENLQVHHCYIHDTGTEGIYLGISWWESDAHPSLKDCKIYSNIIENCGWDCIQLCAADEGTNEVYENYCKNCGTDGTKGQISGIIFPPGTTGDIYRNIVINAYASGIYIHATAKQVDIHDNVIVDSGTFGIAVGTTQSGNSIINNTVVNRDPNQTTWQGITTRIGANLGEIRYNLVVGSGKAGQISSSYSVQDNVTSNSIPDMYFENVAADNFKLAENSPARDYSSKPGYSTRDYDNKLRPSIAGTASDAGAHEYVPGGATTLQPVKDLKILIR